MSEEYSLLERQRRLLAKEKAFLKEDRISKKDYSNIEVIKMDIAEEREKRGMYANPLLAGAVVTQFFGTVAFNDTASYGCTLLAFILLICGVNIFFQHTKRINRLKRALATAESATSP